MSTYLLVHGAWHTATHWNKVAEHLTAMGHRVHALDLPGSGLEAGYPQSDLSNDVEAFASGPPAIGATTLDDYANAVVEAVRELASRRHLHRGKVTLVGHSMGGLAVTKAAEQVPELIERLAYLTAYVPSSVATGAELGALPEGASSISGAILVGDPSKTGAMRINPRNADPDYLEAGRQALYSDVPMEELHARLPGRRRVRRRPRNPRPLGPDPAHVHPHRAGPHRPAGAAGPGDRRRRRAHARQPLRRAHAAVEPLAVRVDARPARSGARHLNPLLRHVY